MGKWKIANIVENASRRAKWTEVWYSGEAGVQGIGGGGG